MNKIILIYLNKLFLNDYDFPHKNNLLLLDLIFKEAEEEKNVMKLFTNMMSLYKILFLKFYRKEQILELLKA